MRFHVQREMSFQVCRHGEMGHPSVIKGERGYVLFSKSSLWEMSPI